MPTVPTYNGPQVREQALEGGFQRAPDVSSDLARAGQGLQQIGQVADAIALRDAKTRADEVDATITSEWLKWDAENRQKYRGGNVDGYAPAAQEWWKKAAETYGKDLDPRAKAMVSPALVRKQGAALANVVQFTGQEKERHADDAAAANIATTIQFGVSTGAVEGAAKQIRNEVALIGARKGWTTEQVQAEQMKSLSALHLAQITKLSATNADAARAYYEANKSEVAAQNQPRVEEVLKGEADNQFATQEAARLADKPLKEQLAEAGKITDPTRREKTLTQIRNNYALVKQAEAEEEARYSDQAWQMFSRGQKIPEAVLSGMNGRERAQLQEAQISRSRRLAEGTPVKTDMATYIDLREKLARGEKVDLRGYTERIGKTEMESLLDIQTATRQGGVKQDSMLTDEQRINTALIGLGINKAKDPEQAARITAEVDRRVRVASASKGGKDLTADEKQAIVDQVTLDKVYVDEWGTDPQKPVVLLEPSEQGNAYVKVNGKNVLVSSVPSDDRRQIIQALNATGQRVTEQAVVEMYLKGQAQKRTSQGRVQ